MHNFSIKYVYPIGNLICRRLFRRSVGYRAFIQLQKHLCVGLVGAILNYVIFNLLKINLISTIWANTIANVIVVLTTFFLQKYYTYQVSHNSIRQPILYVLNSVVYYLLDTVILVILIDYVNQNSFIAKFISLAVLVPISFTFQKYIVFKEKEMTSKCPDVQHQS